jgi:hypothetical protein
MSGTKAYRDWLQQDLGGIIEALELSDLQKHFLHSRWLGQLLWLDGKAVSCQRRYYALRLAAIIGGVIVPALVSLNLQDATAHQAVRWLTSGLSLLVAVSLAVEEFFHFGERWRHYRRTVEALKIEAWQFFQLSGPYQSHPGHREAYPAFDARVEEILQRDVEVFITQVTSERKEPAKN